MARAPFQILVFPYKKDILNNFQYAVFQRPDTNPYGSYWQGIAGGGEGDETPIQAARRESVEESGLSFDSTIIKLDTVAFIPAPLVAGFLWGPEVLVVPEYCFGVNAKKQSIKISEEHQEFDWYPYEKAFQIVEFDTNRNCLWELNYRLTGKSYFPKIKLR